MEVIESEIVIFLRFLQRQKAQLPIDLTELGIEMLSMPEYSNAPKPIVVTVFGIDTYDNSVHQ